MKKLLLLALTLALALSLASCGEIVDSLLTTGPEGEDYEDGWDAGGFDNDSGASGDEGTSAPDTSAPDTGAPDTGSDGASDDGDTFGDGETGLPSNEGDAENVNGPEGEKEPVNDAGDPESSASNDEDWKPAYNEYYYDVENVVLYLEAYDELPPNYITKEEANDLGWTGGSVEDYKPGAAIGGNYFGNYEGLLPKETGRTYTECDIDTDGYSSRGARRLVFSNDGLYFYTDDHYETFREIMVEDGKVIF